MWKLFTKIQSTVPVTRQWEEHPSKESALIAACARMGGAEVVVRYIRGPEGERIEASAIKNWCDAQRH